MPVRYLARSKKKFSILVFFIHAIIVSFFLQISANSANAYDYLAAIEKCVSDQPKQYLVTENLLMKKEDEDIEDSDHYYDVRLKVLRNLTNLDICIYKRWLKSDTYNKPSLISRLINGSPGGISKLIIETYGDVNFERALKLKTWCDKTKNHLCYFNY